MFNELFEQVKRKCNITWEDPDTNARITDIINSAIPDLIHRLGIADDDFDFSQPGIENTIFINYCFYEFNHAMNEFEDNYASVISRTRAIYEVQQYREGVLNEN